MPRIPFGLILMCVLVAPGPTLAEDPWDLTSNGDDDGPATHNELAPGSFEVHDMEAVGGIADQDWFRVSQQPFSSYEVIVDGLTDGLSALGTPGAPLSVQLVQSDGSLVNDSVGLGAGGSARVLHFVNNFDVPISDLFVRVSSPACGTACSAAEQYKIHLHDTTSTIPRFNNSGTQVSILVLQNASDGPITVVVRFLDSAGTQLPTSFVTIPAFGGFVANTSTLGVAGASGSVILAHDGRYGALSGKMVAVEPATGFTFDSPLVPRPE